MNKTLSLMGIIAALLLAVCMFAQAPYHGPNPPPDDCLARCGSTQDCSKGCSAVAKKRTTVAQGKKKTTATVKKVVAK